MKKLGVIAAAAAGVLTLGLPPVLGMLTESSVNARVAAIADNPFVTARIVELDRGWFSSRLKVHLGLSPRYLEQLEALSPMSDDPLPRAALERGATIVVDLTHGPLAVGDGIHLGLSTMVARADASTPGYAELITRLDVPYLFEFRGRTSFLGTLSFDADVPPIDLPTPDGGMRFSGATLNGTFTGAAVAYDARMESFDLMSGPTVLTLQGITARGDNALTRRYFMLGTVDAAVARAAMLDTAVPAAPTIEALNLRFTSHFGPDSSGALVNGQATYALDALDAPDVALRDASFGVVLRNLDADALEAYAEAVQQSGAASFADPGAVLNAITPSVERLLAARPTMAFDPMRFTLNGEAFTARIEIETRADALPPAGALDLRDPALWLELLEATLTAQVSKQLAEAVAVQLSATQLAGTGVVPPDQIEQMAGAQAGLLLVMLVGQGVLRDDGADYSVELRYANGALTAFGQPLPAGVP